MSKELNGILKKLRSLGKPENVAGMARYGIVSKKALGVTAPELKRLARSIGKDHQLALELWSTKIHDARALAAMVDEPSMVSERQMERWVKDFDNWAICDGCCLYLFHKTPFAWMKTKEWSKRKEEFVKRAAFALMAVLTVHDKHAEDTSFAALLPIIKKQANDERNFVKKAVNWALRQIGKQNLALNKLAIRTARELQKSNSASARWIAADALRELTSSAVLTKLKKKRK